MAVLIIVICLSHLLTPGTVEAESIIVNATPIVLDTDHPARVRFDSMTFLNGFRLRSKDRRFGGLSGLAVRSDGSVLYAISDRGYTVSTHLIHDSRGRLIALQDWSLLPLRTPEGGLVGNNLRDAEAIVLKRDGSFLIAFEGVHRIWHYPGLRHIPHPMTTPPDLQGAPPNGGVEAMTLLPDGRLLLLTEAYKNGKNRNKGWLMTGDQFHPLSYVRTDGFKPTDLATIKRDVLVLERYYLSFFGASARLRLINGDDLKPGAQLQGRELLHLQSPLTIDNFEGLAVVDSNRLGTFIYMISDDNFSPFQRTLLLQFRLTKNQLE